MSRVMVAPGHWKDEGPSSARHHGHTYTTRNIEGALVVSTLTSIQERKRETNAEASKRYRERQK